MSSSEGDRQSEEDKLKLLQKKKTKHQLPLTHSSGVQKLKPRKFWVQQL